MEESKDFQGGASTMRSITNMQSLMSEFTYKYMYFYNLDNVREV